jgi:hypothetical protein
VCVCVFEDYGVNRYLLLDRIVGVLSRFAYVSKCVVEDVNHTSPRFFRPSVRDASIWRARIRTSKSLPDLSLSGAVFILAVLVKGPDKSPIRSLGGEGRSPLQECHDSSWRYANETGGKFVLRC